jgi:hypothetical protein
MPVYAPPASAKRAKSTKSAKQSGPATEANVLGAYQTRAGYGLAMRRLRVGL